MEEQGQTVLKEVEMVEELKVEEKAEVAKPEPEQPVSEEETALEAEQPEPTPEPISEIPGDEVLPEASAEVAEEVAQIEEKPDEKEKLVEEVRAKLLACASEKDCIGALLGRFEQIASKLGIPTDTLIEQVFSLLQGEKIES